MAPIPKTRLSERNAERQALAEAIEEVVAVRGKIEEAEAAAEKARARKWRVQEALGDAAQRDVVDAGIAARFIAGDVIDLPSPVDRAKLSHEIVVLTKLESECKKAAEDSKEQLYFAETRRAKAARAVIATSGVVAAALDGFEALQNLMDERRGRLFEMYSLECCGERHEEVKKVLLRGLSADENHHACVAVRNTFDRLMTDADAVVE